MVDIAAIITYIRTEQEEQGWGEEWRGEEWVDVTSDKLAEEGQVFYEI